MVIEPVDLVAKPTFSSLRDTSMVLAKFKSMVLALIGKIRNLDFYGIHHDLCRSQEQGGTALLANFTNPVLSTTTIMILAGVKSKVEQS